VSDRQQPASLAPTINTVTLPNAKKGVAYQSEIFASLKGSHQDVELTVTNLPEGLALENCKQTYDIRIIPIPNTLLTCSVEGTPLNAGTYQLAVTANITNGLVDTRAFVPFLVEGQ
jgi:hypothetical protein